MNLNLPLEIHHTKIGASGQCRLYEGNHRAADKSGSSFRPAGFTSTVEGCVPTPGLTSLAGFAKRWDACSIVLGCPRIVGAGYIYHGCKSFHTG